MAGMVVTCPICGEKAYDGDSLTCCHRDRHGLKKSGVVFSSAPSGVGDAQTRELYAENCRLRAELESCKTDNALLRYGLGELAKRSNAELAEVRRALESEQQRCIRLVGQLR